MCCQIEVSASGLSLVQRSPTECGVSQCDREASTMRRSWPTRVCRDMAGGSPVGSAEQLYVRAPTGYTKVECINRRYVQCILALDVNSGRGTESHAVEVHR